MNPRPTLRIDDRFLGGLVLLGEIPRELCPRIVAALFEHARRPLARAILSLADRFGRFTPDMIAEELARNGVGVGPTLELHELLGQGALPDEMDDLLKMLEERRASPDGRGSKAGPDSWQVLDAAEHREWPVVRPRMIVDPIIAEGTIGTFAALPKVGKSITILDVMLHETHGQDWLGRFAVAKPGPTMLYIAREDPAWRLQPRIEEMQTGYGFPAIPEGRLLILSRERFRLTDEKHLEWLRRIVQERGINFLVLDVLGRMLGALDVMTEWNKAQDILEELNRDLHLTIAILDHTRKPPLGGGKASGTSPLDLKGPIERYGGSDWMVVLAETDHPGRLEVYAESKDSDQRPHFIVEVAPMGAGGPKIRWVSDVERLAKGSREKGQANRATVLGVFQPGEALQAGKVQDRLQAEGKTLSLSAIRGHLATLAKENPPRLTREGKDKDTAYCLSEPASTPERDLAGEG